MSKKFRLKKNSDVIILAIGCSIPEMITNIMSVFDNNKENFNYGFGVIIGSGVFDFTVCFGIAGIYSFIHHERNVPFNIASVSRDYCIYVCTLIILLGICWDNIITFYESMFLMLLYPMYIYGILTFTKQTIEHKKSDSSQEDETTIVIQQDPEMYSVREETPCLGQANLDQNLPQKSPSQQHNPNKIEIIQEYIHNCLQFIIPINNYPGIAFFILIIIISQQTKLIIFLVDNMVEIFHLTPAFLGMTIGSWGGNIGVNSSMAAKQLKTELCLSAIIGGQILNLQLSLGLPWLIYSFLNGPIHIQKENIFRNIIVVFVIVILSLLIMLASRSNLNHKMGISLLFLYGVFFLYQLWTNNHE